MDTQIEIISPPSESLPSKSNNWLILFLVLFCLLALSAAAYFYLQSQQLKKMIVVAPQPSPIEAKSTATATPDPTSNWQTYTSTVMGLEFRYPPSYQPPSEHDSTPYEVGGNYLSVMSPLLPKKAGEKGYELRDGELKVEIYEEPATTDNSSLSCYRDHLADEPENITGEKTYLINQKRVDSVVWSAMGTGELICLTNNQNRYLINKYPAETTRQTEFEQILSTFKFTKASAKPTAKLTATPKPKPSPTSIPKTSTYNDADMGYSITYPPSWTFRRTYGQDIPKAGQTDILDGFDLHYPSTTYNNLSLVGSVLDAYGENDIESWIAQYDLNYPKNATKTSINFNGYPATKYVYSNQPSQSDEAIYFISNGRVYRITYWEKGGISENLREVVHSFQP